MHPGDFLGMSTDNEHAFTAEALEPAQLCWFPRNRFDNFVEEHGAMERELYRMATHELAAARQQMVLLDARRRPSGWRASCSCLRSGPSGSRPPRQSRPAADESLRHRRLSRPTKETVSRVFSSFRRDRLIRLRSADEVELSTARAWSNSPKARPDRRLFQILARTALATGMDPTTVVALALLFALGAALYSSVGHGGASAYIGDHGVVLCRTRDDEADGAGR